MVCSVAVVFLHDATLLTRRGVVFVWAWAGVASMIGYILPHVHLAYYSSDTVNPVDAVPGVAACFVGAYVAGVEARSCASSIVPG